MRLSYYYTWEGALKNEELHHIWYYSSAILLAFPTNDPGKRIYKHLLGNYCCAFLALYQSLWGINHRPQEVYNLAVLV